MVSGPHLVGAETLDDGPVQKHLQFAAMNGELRPPVARCHAARLGPYSLAAFRIVRQGRRGDGQGSQLIGQTQLGQFADSMRQEIDPYTQGLDLIDALVDGGFDADLMEAQSEGQSANTTPNDQNTHSYPLRLRDRGCACSVGLNGLLARTFCRDFAETSPLTIPAEHIARSPDAHPTDLLIGHGAGPGLAVMLHAAGSSPRALDRLAKHLAGQAWSTLAPALVRDGASLAVGAPVFRDAIGLVRSLLDRPTRGSKLLFGHSMGGLIALKAVIGGVKVDALVLYEPIVLALLDRQDAQDQIARAWDADVLHDFQRHMALDDARAGLARFVDAYGDVAWRDLPGPVQSELTVRAPRLLTEAEATHMAELAPADVARLDLPVLILQGSRSPAVLGRMVKRLGVLLPHADIVTIDGAGHMGPISAAAMVGDEIGAFLARHALDPNRHEGPGLPAE